MVRNRNQLYETLTETKNETKTLENKITYQINLKLLNWESVYEIVNLNDSYKISAKIVSPKNCNVKYRPIYSGDYIRIVNINDIHHNQNLNEPIYDIIKIV